MGYLILGYILGTSSKSKFEISGNAALFVNQIIWIFSEVIWVVSRAFYEVVKRRKTVWWLFNVIFLIIIKEVKNK